MGFLDAYELIAKERKLYETDKDGKITQIYSRVICDEIMDKGREATRASQRLFTAAKTPASTTVDSIASGVKNA